MSCRSAELKNRLPRARGTVPCAQSLKVLSFVVQTFERMKYLRMVPRDGESEVAHGRY